MPKLPFQEIQQTLTDHIRDESMESIPGIEDRRLAVYRDLFFNNIESFIAGTFPVLKECVVEQDWQALVRRFFIKHSAQTPYFLEISEEFLNFLEEDNQAQSLLPEFAFSLAHWEWMELFADAYVESSLNKGEDLEGFDPLTGVLTAIECAWLQAYEYPVHTITSGQVIAKAPTFLLVYRNTDDEVKFIELNALSYLLFDALKQNQSKTVTQIVSELAQQHQMPSDQLMAGAIEIIANWNQLQLLKMV